MCTAGKRTRTVARWNTVTLMELNGYVLEPNADLRGARLNGAKLQGIDLSGADLRNANLQGADL